MIEPILQRLQGVRKTGTDQFIARCPAHEDKSPSLSVKDAGGKVLIHCFGGCSTHEVVRSMGLELSCLFERTEKHRGRPLKQRTNYKELWIAARHSFFVILVVSEMLERGEKLNQEGQRQFNAAIARINAVLEADHG